MALKRLLSEFSRVSSESPVLPIGYKQSENRFLSYCLIFMISTETGDYSIITIDNKEANYLRFPCKLNF